MTHRLGRVVTDGRSVNQANGIDLTPGAGPHGPVRFVILNFDNVVLSPGAELRVDLGYGTDVFTANSGSTFWTRPVDTATLPIKIRIVGGNGSATLRKYGSGEPDIPPNQTPGTSVGSLTNPDVFLHDSTYQEPIYETRLECNPGFAWRNAACTLPPITDAVHQRVAAATGIIVEVDNDHVSSCSGTLVGADLFLTARHCLTDANHADLLSSSVTFDYATACDGTRPPGHVTRFFKVIEEVAFGVAATGVTQPPSSVDWVVVRLDAPPGSLPAPLQIRPAALMTGETIFTMHHPNGAAKKTQVGTFGGGTVTGFDYAGGSSGSALFDVNGMLVGGPLSNGGGCSVGYAPAAAVKAGLTSPPPPPQPIDVMVVFDRSGSMAAAAPPVGRSKLAEAQDAAALFVQLVRENQGDRIGLVTFSTQVDLVDHPQPAAAAKGVLVGPAPFTTGHVGAITPGGATSIGAGVGNALLALTSSGTHQRAILLLTDGLQNTVPMLEDVEGSLGNTIVNVIGLGSDADLNGPLLTRVAHAHGGHFTRATDGLALRKFFGLSFGNIFENGALTDPEAVLRADQKVSEPHGFDVCGEERITLVLTWDDEATPLRARLSTPSGKAVSERRIRPVRGRNWAFWRVPLPYDGERDGHWQFTVERVGDGTEFPPPPRDVRYQYLVICSGGPKLVALPPAQRLYTGDPLDLRVGLHYASGTFPSDAEVTVQVTRPDLALGLLTTEVGLSPPQPSGDALDAFHATLQAIAARAGGRLPVGVTTAQVQLFDDGLHDDGAMEPDGNYNHRLTDLTQVEGTYQFRAVARYGTGCSATREAHWSVHVEPGIDPGRTDVTLVDVTTGGGQGGHSSGVLVIVPRDAYGNPVGPGRADLFTVSPMPGVQIVGPVRDRGDGSYEVPVAWDPAATGEPGVLVHQPDRDPVVVGPKPGPACRCGRDCRQADCCGPAGELLRCLGLADADVHGVQVTSVNLRVDLEASPAHEDCGCGRRDCDSKRCKGMHGHRRDGHHAADPPGKPGSQGCGCR